MDDASACLATIAALAAGGVPDAEHIAACAKCAALVGGLPPASATPALPFSLPSVAALAARSRMRSARNVGVPLALAAAILLCLSRLDLSESPNSGVEPDLLALADVSLVTADESATDADDDAYGGETLALLDPFAGDDLFAADDLDLTPVPDSTSNQGDL